MNRVLIITYSFPPIGNIAAQRFGKMVQYLRELGWDPYVLTTHSTGAGGVSLPDDHVVRVGTHVQAGPRISCSQAGLPQAYPFNVLKRLQRRLGWRLMTFDRHSLSWYRHVRRKMSAEFRRVRPDVIVASYGPAAAVVLGRHLSRLYRVPWIADYRDLGALKRRTEPGLMAMLDRGIERHLLHSVSGLTTVSTDLSDELSRAYGKPCVTIYNGFEPSDWRRQSVSEDHRTRRLYYAGRFYDHQIRSVYLLLDAIAAMDGLSFDIRSLGPSDLEEKIIRYARAHRIEDRVRIMPPVDQDQVESDRVSALANVVFEDLGDELCWGRGVLTGKFLQLVPHRAPILVVARSDSNMADILRLTEKGVVCSTRQAVIRFLSDVLDEPSRYAGNDRVSEFSKRTQAARLARFLNEVTGTELQGRSSIGQTGDSSWSYE